MENRVKLPKLPEFRWHSPRKENQSWPLTTDDDWVRLAVIANRPNKLLIRRPKPKVAKQPITPLQIDEAPYYTSIKLKSSNSLKGTPSPNSTPTAKSPSPASPSRIASNLLPPQPPKLNLLTIDVFDSDVEENLGQADDEDSDHDDSEDSDFMEWQADGSEESDSFSLDEEDDLEPENESLDDIDLENDTQLRMTLGYGSIDDDMSENFLIVNKMAKLFRHGKMWSRNRDGKDYCVQYGITSRKIKNTKSRYTQRRINNDYPFKIHAAVLIVPDYSYWRARKLMKNVVEGNDEGYKVLPDYMRVFKEKTMTLYVLSTGRMRALARIHLLRDV
ncbi:hypothetical protein Cgig2_000906 [Carnegiea gigantea]|uniref:Uncharacterized protein n=1 Tax=Carnegiea gigantea TaxID=171969 RepID=A0A9Q1KNM1_9CARY|nr:hypothetical protein Cgig2_000906 [Carnegiea gigantea]